MADDILYKRPGEIRKYLYDFTPLLPDDAALDSASSTVSGEDSTEQDADIVGEVTVSGMNLSCMLSAGRDGEDYKVIFSGQGNTTAEVREWVLEVRVREDIGGPV